MQWSIWIFIFIHNKMTFLFDEFFHNVNSSMNGCQMNWTLFIFIVRTEQGIVFNQDLKIEKKMTVGMVQTIVFPFWEF